MKICSGEPLPSIAFSKNKPGTLIFVDAGAFNKSAEKKKRTPKKTQTACT
jgi:hypothetical protein